MALLRTKSTIKIGFHKEMCSLPLAGFQISTFPWRGAKCTVSDRFRIALDTFFFFVQTSCQTTTANLKKADLLHGALTKQTTTNGPQVVKQREPQRHQSVALLP